LRYIGLPSHAPSELKQDGSARLSTCTATGVARKVADGIMRTEKMH
jgi:hypothetical protein